ncbi:hypothetical protein GYMLUDRAFT_82183 [Collybiopsis luxurians FD-317 M1]|nr:hypothetical protein GYMLUDRAFT_82183 [Collybiopsis luxurians FD-317 M1]
MRTRSRSASPFTRRDFGVNWYLREDGIENEDLRMDPADLAEFSSVKVFRPFHPRSMCWVDRDKVLKLCSYLIDVSVMVANMDLPRTRVPVPRVLRYGYSRNCSYILMERIPNPNIPALLLQLGIKEIPSGTIISFNAIVREITSLGLSHNDLVPRNMLGDTANITSIVDWDACTPIHTGGEYARRVKDYIEFPDGKFPGEQNLYHAFLRYSFDRTGEEIILGCSDRHPKMFLPWPLVKSKSYQQISSPVMDPRNQSFSVSGLLHSPLL